MEYLKVIENFQMAQYCIQSMKDNKTFENHKIGIVIEEFFGMCVAFEKGEIVIFREELNVCFPRKTVETICVEKPLRAKIIKDNLKKGNLITTCNSIVSVPKKYVKEISDIGYTVIGKVVRVEGTNVDYGDIYDDGYKSKLALPLLNFLNKEVVVTIRQLE